MKNGKIIILQDNQHDAFEKQLNQDIPPAP